MKTSAIIRIIAWSIAAIFFTALLISMLYGNGIFGIQVGSINLPFSIGGTSMISYKDEERYTAGGSTVSAGDIHSMDINWTSGSVTVKAGSGKDIRFYEQEDNSLSENEKLRWLVSDGKLTIQFCKSGLKGANFFKNITGKNLVVEVPSGTSLDDFSLDCVSASADVSGFDSDNFDLDSVSGGVMISGVNCSNVNIDSVSGRLELTDFSADSLEMDTTSGKVSVSGVFSSVDIDTVSGSIAATLSKCPDSFDADTISGSVTLTVPANSGFTADLSTVSGSKKCEIPAAINGNTYVCGSGSSDINICTTSGSISILAD